MSDSDGRTIVVGCIDPRKIWPRLFTGYPIDLDHEAVSVASVRDELALSLAFSPIKRKNGFFPRHHAVS